MSGNCCNAVSGTGDAGTGCGVKWRCSGQQGSIGPGPNRVPDAVRRRGGPASSASSPNLLSRFARATAALALTALVMSGATLSLVTPVHAASDGDLRIEDGPSDNEGRLEIFHDAGSGGEWRSVCDDRFSWRDVEVACRQLGYTGGTVIRGGYSAPSTPPFWLDDVGCTGSESRLDMCPHPGWGQHNCAAQEAVGVRCSGTRQIPEPPPAPKPATDLSASDETTTTVSLSWTLPAQPGDVTATRVEVQQQSGTSWSTVATLGAAATTHTVTGLTAGTTYSFRVRLVTSAGNAHSDAVSADTLAVPSAATGLAASDPTQTTVDLSWTLPAQGSGVSVTRVEVHQQSGTTWNTVATLGAAATTHTVRGLTAGTTYSFRVRLVTSAGNADTDAVSADTLAVPRAATGLAASDPTQTTIDLSWRLPVQGSGVSVTRVEVHQQSGTTWNTVATLGAAATTHTVTGLTAGTTYSFRIRLVTSGGHADSDAVSTNTLAAPRAATGLAASDASQTTVDLSWTLPAQRSGVSVTGVEVQQQSGATWSTVATLGATATTHTVTGLTAGTTHSFRIRLVTSGGHADSDTVSVTTTDEPAQQNSIEPLSANGLTASNPTQTAVDLAWTLPAQPEGVTVTRVEVQRQSGETWGTAATLGAAATTHTVTGLRAGRTYSFRIRLVTSGGDADSDAVSAHTLAYPRPARGLSASNPTQTTLDLAWTLQAQGSGVTVTSVEVQEQTGTTYSTLATLGTSATTHRVTGLTAGTNYRFQIRLVTNLGSAYSDSVLAATLVAPTAATGLAASNPTQTTVDLAWTLPAQGSDGSVTGVKVQQQSDTTWSTVATLGASATTHTVTGLTAGTTYNFRIRLVRSGGNADSGAVSATTLDEQDQQISDPPPAPKPVTGLSASTAAMPRTIDLSWTLPAQSGGVTVTRVEVQQYSDSDTTWSTVATLGTTATTHAATGLTDCETYSFRIRLVTSSGNADSDTVSADTLAVPTAPPWPTVSKVTGATVALAWRLPKQHPRVTVTGVEVEHSSSSTWATVARLAADATSHTVTGLSAQTRHRFRIRIVGTEASKTSLPETVTTLAAEAATGLTASNATLTTVDLAWTLPAQPRGVTVTGVWIQRQVWNEGQLSSNWRSVATLAADATSYTVTGRTPGTEYRFRIRTITSNGSAYSDPVSATTPSTGLTVSNVAGTTVDLAWTAPDASESVTGVQVQYRRSSTSEAWRSAARLAADATSHTVTGLTGETAYSFRVRFLTTDGSVDSESVSATTLVGPIPVPGLTASIGTEAITLSWTVPEQPEGVTVTGVKVLQEVEAAWSTVATLAADATSYRVTGLTPATTYRFIIRIASDQGNADAGEYSLTTSLALAATPGDGEVTLAWSDATNARGSFGLPITRWEIRRKEADAGAWGAWTRIAGATAETVSHTVTGLENGTRYAFQVRARALRWTLTSSGTVEAEPASTTSTANPATGLAASSATQTAVDLAWTLPTQPEGVTLTGVEVQQQAADESWTTVATLAADATSHTVTGLTAGTAYTFRIRLVTNSGNSDSEPVDVQTAHMPLDAKMAGSVPEPGDAVSGQSRSPDDGCAVEVLVEFLDADGNAVAVESLAASNFTAVNGLVGTPVADADGLGWTVPVRAAPSFTGLMRVRLAETERWTAAEQVFRVASDSKCAPVARNELASLALDGLDLDPAFEAGTRTYAAVAPADTDMVTVTASTVYGASEVAVAPGDADTETEGHQVALAEGGTEVTVTVTPADGDAAAQTWTVTVTREAGAGVLTGFVLVDTSNDADLGAVTADGTVSVSATGSYGVRAGIEANAEVGSVVLSLAGPGETDTHTRTENVAPYSLYGDAPGGANGRAEHGRALAAGSYTLTATAYAERAGAGDVLGTLTVPFKVAVEAAPPPPAGVLTGFALLDASDQSTVATLTNGADIGLGDRSGGSFAIRADVAPGEEIGSVALSLTGSKTVSATENLAPYSLWGDRNDGNGGRALDGSSLPAGSYTLTATAHAGRGASGTVLGIRSVSFEVLAPAALSVADAQAEEGTDATLDFAVTLDRETTNTVTVEYATADGTATAGSDYTATSGTLTFQPGETEKTVSVPVLEDDHDEGSETLAFRLSNAQGANIADGEATGTITNSDAIPQAWLARFGRTVTSQVLDAVEARLTAPRDAGADVSLAGQALPSWRADGRAGSDTRAAAKEERAEAEDRAALASMTAWLTQVGRDPGRVSGARDQGTAWFGAAGDGMGREHESRALTQRDLMVGTSFALTGGSSKDGGYASLWGRGSIAGFDGREGSLTVDGEVTTGLIGADWASDPGSGSGRWIAGLAIGHSTGTGGWRRGGECDANCGGKIEATLTGLYPYAGMDLTERLSVWAAAGWGSGEVTVTPEGKAGMTTDLSMSMGAAGLRSAVLRPEDGDGLTLDLKGDARFTRTSSDAVRSESGNLAAAEADVWLLRTGLEGSRPVALGEGGATLTPSFEIGLRLDGGDAETGMGADLGGGVAFSDPENGVALDLKARGLVAHESPGFREWGASISASWDPRPSTDRGLSLSLTQSWGASPAGGMDALLSRETLAGLAANDNPGKFEASSRLEGEIGYGLPAFGGRFTGTPNVGFALSDGGAREWRLGWRLTSAIAGDPGFEVSLDATRRELANDEEPEHGAMLRATIRW